MAGLITKFMGTLMDVQFDNDGKKATFTFLDEESLEVRDVVFNKQSWDSTSKKFVDDPEKAKKVDEWCEDIFNTKFDKLTNCIDEKHEVFVYEKFNSLWESNTPTRFKAEDLGEMIDTQIEEITVDNIAIHIKYKWQDDVYESKMSWGKWIEKMKTYLPDPNKKITQYEKFNDKFGVPVEEKDSLIGQRIMVEVKCAFGNAYYGDIKKISKK